MNQDNKESSSTSLGRLKEAVRQDQGAAGRFDETLAAFLGVNRTDTRCLDIVDRHGRITAGRLAVEAGLTTGAVTVLVDRLEAAGYVRRERDRKDRRKVWIALTDHACEILHRIFGQFGEIGDLMVAGYSQAEIEAIVRYLSASAAIVNARATLLETHHPGAEADARARREKARAFAQDAHTMSCRIRAHVTQGAGISQSLFED